MEYNTSQRSKHWRTIEQSVPGLDRPIFMSEAEMVLAGYPHVYDSHGLAPSNYAVMLHMIENDLIGGDIAMACQPGTSLPTFGFTLETDMVVFALLKKCPELDRIIPD